MVIALSKSNPEIASSSSSSLPKWIELVVVETPETDLCDAKSTSNFHRLKFVCRDKEQSTFS